MRSAAAPAASFSPTTVARANSASILRSFSLSSASLDIPQTPDWSNPYHSAVERLPAEQLILHHPTQRSYSIAATSQDGAGTQLFPSVRRYAAKAHNSVGEICKRAPTTER